MNRYAKHLDGLCHAVYCGATRMGRHLRVYCLEPAGHDGDHVARGMDGRERWRWSRGWTALRQQRRRGATTSNKWVGTATRVKI